VLAADGSATANLSSLNGGPIAGSRNRIINGDMRIDQRNAGASTSLSDATYYLDRWRGVATQGSKANVVQSSTAPAGFSNSLLVTSSSAYSITSSDIFAIQQRIEGFNFSDFGWGAAGATSITLSFWVRSSLTGTFGGALLNSAQNRSYPFTFSISAANTFELKSITIAGDTSGTWIGATNGIGAIVCFGLGAGATYSGTAGAWSGSAFYSATGATSVVGTNGATFYITGVQLEPGSVATPFERRSYGAELALCQRYCYGQNNSAGQAYYYFGIGLFTSSAGTTAFGHSIFPVTMRAKPSVTFSAANTFFVDPNVTNFTTAILDQASVNGGGIQLSGGSGGGAAPAGGRLLSNNTAAAYIIWSAEL
jgi:hypothetical protein